jgi:tetratricopeptide (TPR) repeat protein
MKLLIKRFKYPIILLICLFALGLLMRKSIVISILGNYDHIIWFKSISKNENMSCSDCEKILLRVKELYPEDLTCNRWLGFYYYLTGEYSDSEKELKFVYHYSSNDPTVDLYLGWIYYRKGDRAEAINIWE